jgi:hypothetical protein
LICSGKSSGGRRIGSLSSPPHWFAPKKERRSCRRPFDFHTNKFLTLGRDAVAAETVECDRIKAILGIKSGITSGRNPRGYGLSGIDRRLDDTRRAQ